MGLEKPRLFEIKAPVARHLAGDRKSPKSEQSPLCLQGSRSYLVWKGVQLQKKETFFGVFY